MKEVMNGVDIASYQAGMDCTKIEADFVIVKATQGTGYTNPYFSKHYAQAVAAGKLVGAYHYASGGDANAEADYSFGSSDTGPEAARCSWTGNTTVTAAKTGCSIHPGKSNGSRSSCSASTTRQACGRFCTLRHP